MTNCKLPAEKTLLTRCAENVSTKIQE